MKGFRIRAPGTESVRFTFDERKAPETCQEFIAALPFEALGVQARFAGEEIWIKQGPDLKIKRENSSIRPKFGEMGYVAPRKGSELSRSIAIAYGEVKLSESANIFARVIKSDRGKLKSMGRNIWLKGQKELKFIA